MPKPRPILRCAHCAHDLSALIETPWIRTCPECGKKFDPDFIYEGNARNSPEPNAPPPRDRGLHGDHEND